MGFISLKLLFVSQTNIFSILFLYGLFLKIFGRAFLPVFLYYSNVFSNRRVSMVESSSYYPFPPSKIVMLGLLALLQL